MSTNHPGIGAMLANLSNDADSVAAYTAALGKTISAIALTDDRLTITFEDGTTLRLHDDGQSCCESRYLRSDADLPYYVGATLTGIEVRDAPDIEDEHGESHEVQFLNVTTSKGTFDVVAHNEHNGYYGGFAIRCSAS